MKKLDKIEKVTIQEEDGKSIVAELNNSFEKATGLELVVEGVKYSVVGAFMGSSDAVPGYSGGTTLALIGFYKRLMLLARNVFIPDGGMSRWKALLLLTPFVIGWMIGIFGFAHFTEMLSTQGYGLELMFFFSTFILITTPIFLLREKPGLVVKKKVVWSRKWIYFFIGFIAIISLSVVVLVVNGGFTATHDSSHKLETHYDLSHLVWLKLVGVSIVGGALALVPGGSGAMIQLVGGTYDKVHWVMLTHINENIGGLAIYGVSTIVGMIATVILLGWWIKKHQHSMAAFSLGMLIASIAGILIVPTPDSWGVLTQGYHHIVGVVIASMLGIILGISVYIFALKKSKKSKKERKV